MPQVTLDLPEDVYERMVKLAQFTGQNLNDLLTTTVILSYPPLLPQIDLNIPVSALSDEVLLSESQLHIAPEYDLRQSELLEKQQNGTITEMEASELQALMRVYEIGLLRKSQALEEAIRRGLHPSLSS